MDECRSHRIDEGEKGERYAYGIDTDHIHHLRNAERQRSRFIQHHRIDMCELLQMSSPFDDDAFFDKSIVRLTAEDAVAIVSTLHTTRAELFHDAHSLYIRKAACIQFIEIQSTGKWRSVKHRCI